MGLFAIVLVELYNLLQDAGCGVHVKDPGGKMILISLLAFVDDLVLITSCPVQLQKALPFVAVWARKVRIRLNVGSNKSAIMAWGHGRISDLDKYRSFFIGVQPMPRVLFYKYIGVRLGCGEDGRITSNSWQKSAGPRPMKSLIGLVKTKFRLPSLCVSGSCTLNVQSSTAQAFVSLHQRSSSSSTVRTGVPGAHFWVFDAWHRSRCFR